MDRSGERLGVERQESACRRVAEERGWNIVEVFSDPSVSAFDAKAHRPGYERLRRAYADGRFTALVVWDLDRLTRQPKQLEEWLEAAERQGLSLATATGEGDLTTHEGRMFARIKISVSRYESEQKGARQRLANRQRAEAGKALVSRRPFGFEKDRVTHNPPRSGRCPTDLRRLLGRGFSARDSPPTPTPWNPDRSRQ